MHQGVSTESRQNTPENHGAHDPGTEEALRNLEAQVKEMRKTVQEQETNLHTVHGYVSLLLCSQPLLTVGVVQNVTHHTLLLPLFDCGFVLE